MRKLLNALYVNAIEFEFLLRKTLLGFGNANCRLMSMDKRAMVNILRRNGAHIGDYCDIESPLILHNCQEYGNLIIGNHCHLGKGVFLDLRARIVLEDRVTVSMRSIILTHFDVGESLLKRQGFPSTSGNTILKKDCYVGANVVILHGVTVGESAVVSAGAVVTKDVTPFTVVGGVPARIIRETKR